MDETSRIVAGLSGAQWRAIEAASSGSRRPHGLGVPITTCEALVRKSVFWRGSDYVGRQAYALTTLGLAVKAHLKDTTHAG